MDELVVLNDDSIEFVCYLLLVESEVDFLALCQEEDVDIVRIELLGEVLGDPWACYAPCYLGVAGGGSSYDFDD